jgi:hypothetical protein
MTVQFTNGSKMTFKKSNALGNAGTVPVEARVFRGWQGAYPVFELPDGTWVQEAAPVANVLLVPATVPGTPRQKNETSGINGD